MEEGAARRKADGGSSQAAMAKVASEVLRAQYSDSGRVARKATDEKPSRKCEKEPSAGTIAGARRGARDLRAKSPQSPGGFEDALRRARQGINPYRAAVNVTRNR